MGISDRNHYWYLPPVDLNQNSVSKVNFSVENDAVTFVLIWKSVQAVENPEDTYALFSDFWPFFMKMRVVDEQFWGSQTDSNGSRGKF